MLDNLEYFEVKYFAPTSTRGARIKLTRAGESVTVARDYKCDAVDQAAAIITDSGEEIAGKIELKNSTLIIIK